MVVGELARRSWTMAISIAGISGAAGKRAGPICATIMSFIAPGTCLRGQSPTSRPQGGASSWISCSVTLTRHDREIWPGRRPDALAIGGIIRKSNSRCSKLYAVTREKRNTLIWRVTLSMSAVLSPIILTRKRSHGAMTQNITGRRPMNTINHTSPCASDEVVGHA